MDDDVRLYESDRYFPEIRCVADLMNTPMAKYRIKKLLKPCDPKKHEWAVDFGCASGTMCFALSRYVQFVTGIDISVRAVKIARRLCGKKEYPNIWFWPIDAQWTPWACTKRSATLILCADLLEHVYKDVATNIIAEAYRILAKGGRFVVWTPCPSHYTEVLRRWNILPATLGHVDYKTMRWIVDRMKLAGFEIDKAEYHESHLPVIRAIERCLMRWVPLFRRRIAVVGRKV